MSDDSNPNDQDTNGDAYVSATANYNRTVMADKSETQLKLLEQARRLSNNLRVADSVSEKNPSNSRLVQTSKRDEILRGRSGSQGSKTNVIAAPAGFLKQSKPASTAGSRAIHLEMPEEFLQDRFKSNTVQRNNQVQSELRMSLKERSPLVASSEFKQHSLASGLRTIDKPLMVPGSSD